MSTWAMAWLQPERRLRTVGRGRGGRLGGLLEIPWDRAWVGFLLMFVLGAVVPLAILHHHVIDPETLARVARWKRKTNGNIEPHSIVAESGPRFSLDLNEFCG